MEPVSGETEWERPEAFMRLTLDEIRQRVAAFGIVPDAFELLTEGKANTNYRIDSPQGRFVLRLYQRNASVIALEAAVLGRLPDAFPTPRIVARGEGCLLLEYFDGVSLERILQERRPFDAEAVARRLAEARLLLDEQGQAAPGLFSNLDELRVAEPWPSAVEGLLNYLRHLLPESGLPSNLHDRAAIVVDDAQPRLEAIAGPPVLVHGDFKPSNLLVGPNGEVGVLDWEFAHAGTRLSDVGQLLRFAESLPQGFQDAFCRTLGLDDEAALLARTLDLVNLVAFAAASSERPAMQRGVATQIRTVADLYQARFAV